MSLAGLPGLVVPCGLAKGGTCGLPVGLQMIGPAFGEVNYKHVLQNSDRICIFIVGSALGNWHAAMPCALLVSAQLLWQLSSMSFVALLGSGLSAFR